MEAIPTVPLPLLQSILAFAVPGYVEYLPVDQRSRVTCFFNELKLVSKAWVDPMREIVHQYRDSTLMLKFETASDQELEQRYRWISEMGDQITELHVVMGTFDRFTRYFSLKPTLREVVETVAIDWPRIFAQLKRLKTLDLSAMKLESCHVVGAIDAAATYCLNLDKLVLPYEKFVANDDKIQAVLVKLYGALKRWKEQGNCGGLRQLTVPTRNSNNKFRASKEFFENVMEFCPLIECLDGYKVSLSTFDRLTCKETWLLTLDDWERLNAACRNLREFDWVVAPFGDPYVRAFGEHNKPQLKKLTFGVNMHWNWRWYFHDSSRAAGAFPIDDWEEENYCERPGYGYLATDPAAALKGCPNLDELIVRLYHAVDREMYIPPDMGDVYDFPEEEMVNQNIFDDHFCETLALECPFISHFVIQEMGEYFNREELKPIVTFTDRGLMALTKLKFLRSLQLRSINCTGKGVLEFLNAQSKEFTGNRTFEITVGGSPVDSRLTFYDVVKELLVQLAEASDLPCASRKFALRLENWSYNSRFSVDPAWSEAYFRDLNTLMNRVKDMYPSLRQHVVTMDRSGDSFSRIAEFGLYSVHMQREIYCCWEDWEEEGKNEGITIVDREDLLDDDRNIEDDVSGYEDENWYLDGDFYDGEGESDIDSEYFEDDSDFEM
ncbi:hypothetical protein PF008_g12651 [Phytophthora fragariae]|uniref:Uncharacterized protein n=1 Tax=Phytophthora fragariae TaxID=53985 RepID=A0A6G0RNR0_9STRA|nr:hypothetical protein PF008_g12651 [Phytophthora fragariae]